MSVLVAATANPDYEVRYQDLEGTTYLVVPIIMMREGVHAGSGGPLYYPPQTFGNNPFSWNGVPVVIDHTYNEEGIPVSANSPQFASQKVGTIYNTKYEDGVLSGEAWIEDAKLQKISPAAYNAIIARRPLDVSTGSISEINNSPGEWNGEEYTATLAGWIPDHMALLPNGTGACSWQDGCGIRLNKEDKLDKTYVNISKTKDGEKIDYPVYVNAGYKSLVNMIASKLDMRDNAERYHFLEDVYDEYFVYRVERRNQPSEYFKQGYEYNESNQSLEFGGDPEHVRKVIDYQTVNTDAGGNKMSDKCKCSEDKVNALIEASDTFTSDDKEALMGLSEEKVDQLTANAKAAKEVKVNKETDKEDKEISLEDALEVVGNKIKPDQLLKLLPTDVQEHIQIGLNSHKEQHEQLVNEVKELQEEFTEEELKGMSVPQLKRFAKAIGSAKPSTSVDYSGLGGGILNLNTGGADNGDVPILPIANAKGGDA